MIGKRTGMSGNIIRGIGIGLIIICLISVYGTGMIYGNAAENESPYDIMLSWTDNPKTSMTVTWHSAVTGESGIKVSRFRNMTRARSISATKTAVKSGIPLPDYIYSGKITGLEPNTHYYYKVFTGRSESGVKEFTTAPEKSVGIDAEPFSFLYMGDINLVSDAGQEYAEWGKLLKKAYAKEPGIKFGMLGGDLVESGISRIQFELLLKNACDVYSKIPFMPANGNHECNFANSGKPELYMDMFTLPENGPEGFKEEFYSFDYSTVHITVLDSWVFSGEQKVTAADIKRIAEWIRNDISGSNAKFNIVMLHHTAYSLVKDNVADKVKEKWAPLFEQCGVDLVLCGHQHVYARSYPMKAGYIDPVNGVTYIMGFAGKKAYSTADESWQEKIIYNRSNYQILRVDGNTLSVSSFDADGKALDYWSMSARKKTGLKK
ncbi:MAG: fibronectin type III domain-containing protein [Anaerovoracaceae bacterium]